jgi:hypothetical protein
MKLPLIILFILMVGSVNAETYKWENETIRHPIDCQCFNKTKDIINAFYNPYNTDSETCRLVYKNFGICKDGEILCPDNYAPDELKGICVYTPGFTMKKNKTEIYTPKFKLTIDDFFGKCNDTLVQQWDLEGIGECVGNFLSPVFPNPLKIISPLYGADLQDKLNTIKIGLTIYDKDGKLSIGAFGESVLATLDSLFNLPFVFFATILEIIFNAVKYVLVFAWRFGFVYVVYISLGFQALMLSMNNSYSLQHPDRMRLTFILLGVGTILLLSFGGGWVAWVY